MRVQFSWCLFLTWTTPVADTYSQKRQASVDCSGPLEAQMLCDEAAHSRTIKHPQKHILKRRLVSTIDCIKEVATASRSTWYITSLNVLLLNLGLQWFKIFSNIVNVNYGLIQIKMEDKAGYGWGRVQLVTDRLQPWRPVNQVCLQKIKMAMAKTRSSSPTGLSCYFIQSMSPASQTNDG